MQKLLVVFTLALLQAASGFGVQQAALRSAAHRPQVSSRRFATAMPQMQEGEAPAEAESEEEVMTPAPPTPPKPAFDITNYSLTITLVLVFAVAKGLGALGIIDAN